jgi:hypothetical protein
MEKIMEWLMSLDSTKLVTIATIALVVWILSMIIIVIGILKNKFNATSIKSLLEKSKLDNQKDILNNINTLKDEIVGILGTIQEDFIARDAENTAKRLEAIKSLANDVETSAVEISDIPKETLGISKILDSLEE